MKSRVTNFFSSSSKRGEVQEMREDLRSSSSTRRKNALKQSIASMTVGKDMSALFTDVVNCMQSNNLEVKKLVYLYVMNYAKTQPDLAILAVNTFVNDTQDYNPLVRALAIRTMSCIRLRKIVEYLADPLRRALKDEDPYVRKTAVVAVAKVHDISAELAERGGFVRSLQAALHDGNPMVLSNAVCALTDIARKQPSVFALDKRLLPKLLVAVNECNEWGQVALLDVVARYVPQGAREAEAIMERVVPRLQHANCAVVLAAVRAVFNVAGACATAGGGDGDGGAASVDMIKRKKVVPSMLSLVSSNQPPEVTYIALRAMNLLTRRDPTLFRAHVRSFFCNYNDPNYVRREKLEILVRLAASANYKQVLEELRGYAAEVDVSFAQLAVNAIGRVAVALACAADAAVEALLALMRLGAPHIVQQVLVSVRDVMRRYRGRFDEAAATKLIEASRLLDDETGEFDVVRYDGPEARAALVWMLGEVACTASRASALATQMLRKMVLAPADESEGFADEVLRVQLQMLSAAAKLRLRSGSSGGGDGEGGDGDGQDGEGSAASDLFERVCALALNDCDSADLRDRAVMYQRLLEPDALSAASLEAARAVVLCERPCVDALAVYEYDDAVLSALVGGLDTIASAMHTTAAELGFRRAGEAAPGAAAAAAAANGGGPQAPDGKRAIGAADSEADLLGERHAAIALGSGSSGDDGGADVASLSAEETPVVDGADLLDAGLSSSAGDQLGDADAVRHRTASDSSTSSASGAASSPSPPPSTSYSSASASVATQLQDFSKQPSRILLDPNKGKGLRVTGGVVRAPARSEHPYALSAVFENLSAGDGLGGFAIQFNTNAFGLTPAEPLRIGDQLARSGDSTSVELPLKVEPAKADEQKGCVVQIAVKCAQLGVLYFADTVPLGAFLEPIERDVADTRALFVREWNRLGEDAETRHVAPLRHCDGAESVKRHALRNVGSIVAERTSDDKGDHGGHVLVYGVSQIVGGATFFSEAVIRCGECELGVRSEAAPQLVRAFLQHLVGLL